MGFGDDIGKEFEKIEKKRDHLIKSAVVNLRSDLIEVSPEDKGELKASWEQPKEVGKGKWIITNIAPHAQVIDDGRRQVPINGVERWVGSERLPHGFSPTIEVTEKALAKEFKKL